MLSKKENHIKDKSFTTKIINDSLHNSSLFSEKSSFTFGGKIANLYFI